MNLFKIFPAKLYLGDFQAIYLTVDTTYFPDLKFELMQNE